MAEGPVQMGVKPVERPMNLIPVALKEAALDSPTFRAIALHFSDQIDVVERWLEGYVKAASKLVSEVSSFESLVNSFLSHSTPPAPFSEAVLDHDYTLLAMKRYGEGAREFWQDTFKGVKRYDTSVVDPIKGFLNNELRGLKDARRVLDANQKIFDALVSRYMGQGKSKEASSLREDAFQLHEARKAYLKAAMDFCVLAPQVRASLDKLVVRIFAEQWKDMRTSREANATLFAKTSSEMERVRSWSREMEDSERAFKRELLAARRQIEDNAEQLWRPSRELDDYSASTVPYLGKGAASTSRMASPAKPGQAKEERQEKQGWLFQKGVTGKPSRTIWSRRWFFVKNGIFGWLMQGLRSGGVEESEKIGVLLCGVRPAIQEERRFCFEVKTKDTSIILQAETQHELTEWINAFEVVKRKALEEPTSTGNSAVAPGIDPAFAITQPIAPEFAAKTDERHGREGNEDPGLSVPEREGTLGGIATRQSSDVGGGRRVLSLEREPEGTRDRIISKLDLHKRSTAASSQLGQAGPTSGLASLIAASHNIMPIGPGMLTATVPDTMRRDFTLPTSTLAPLTLANPPAPTNLSHTAVVVSGERGVDLGSSDRGDMPSGIMANLWGSSNWGHVNRLGDDAKPQASPAQPSSPALPATTVSQDDSHIMDGATGSPAQMSPLAGLGLPSELKALSVGEDQAVASAAPTRMTFNEGDEYLNYYPLPLKAQQAQFRMLFPGVPRSEKVVLVFRATWNPNEQQEFPGRVYVTTKEMYFYSHHLGLVLITGASLANINEVTAAPGRDCDFLYLHLKERVRQEDGRRITVKTFIEPLHLLQRRLSFLVHNASAAQPVTLQEALKTLIKMEAETPQRSSSVESWEDAIYNPNEAGAGAQSSPLRPRQRNVKASLRIDGNLYGEPAKTGKEIQKFKLPSQAVQYAPQGMQASISREFDVSAKALFHVMFGDKSAVFQLLYYNRWGDKIVQTPWAKAGNGHWTRSFSNQIITVQTADRQVIDIYNDHLCYVVTNNKCPFRLPYSNRFSLTTKLVITHAAKSKCKLAMYQCVSWSKPPMSSYVRRLLERQALNALEADALDLSNVAMDQVAKLGNHSKTDTAIEIFGNIGQHPQVPQIDSTAAATIPSVASTTRSKRSKKLTLLELMVNDAFARLLSLFTVVFDLVLAVGKGVIDLCTSHTLLVALLVVSVAYNSWYGYRDSLGWYQERSAGKFMARLGVTPEPAMSKAIYLSDIDDFIAPTVANDTLAGMILSGTGDVKTCRTTFREELVSFPGSGHTYRPTARLHRSRDAIARYRHDLLVALRVVNGVEKDVVLAGWEVWVRFEEKKCARIAKMLARQYKGKGMKAADVDMELGEDFAEYCRSCRVALERIGNETGFA